MLTTGEAPFIESARSHGELYIRQPYELYSEENHQAWRKLYARMLPRWERYGNEHFRKGIEADPHFTVLRLDLARLLVAEGRIAEARRELERVANETAPTNVADWTARDRPRARTRLDELRDRK